MFAIGHFALGYLTGKVSSKLLDVKISLPIIFALSVIPDIDLLFSGFEPTLFMHRGPTHSLITSTIFFLPFLIHYKKRALPYFLVLLSHAFADFFTGGLELLWPLSTNWFGLADVYVKTLIPSLAELLLFIFAAVIMFKSRDLHALLHPNNRNLVLIVSFFAVLGPIAQFGGNAGYFPILLVPPSIFCLGLFTYSMSIDLYAKAQRLLQSPSSTKV